MAELDLEHLLGGFATNTLTDAEHQALYRAAMVNQRLFDLLADEQALRELLDDPTVRRRLLDKLKDPPGQERTAWVSRWLGWVVRPETLTVAGSLAVLALATVLGLQLWEQSQSIKRTEESAPPLSKIIKEPTVKSKLGTKSTPPKPARPQEERVKRTEEPSGRAPVKAEQEPPRSATVSPKAEKTAPASPPDSQSASPAGPAPERTAAAKKERSKSADVVAENKPQDEAEAESTHAVPLAPAQLPPVVLPRVPAKVAKSEPDQPTEAHSDSSSSSAPSDSGATAGDTEKPAPEALEEASTSDAEFARGREAEATSPASPDPEPVPEPEPSLEMEPESVVAAARPQAPPAAKPTQPLPFVDNLERPVVGNARSLFAEALATQAPSADNTSATGGAKDVQPGALERHQILGALSKGQESDGTEHTTDAEAAGNPTSHPLALRFHHTHTSPQGSRTGPLNQGFAIPRLTLEVNQPGYLYVIMGDASGGWTVLSPAGSRGTTPAPAQPNRPYEVILLADAREQAIRPSYVVLSKKPVPELDKALALASAADRPTDSSMELDTLISTWVSNFGDQSLKMEQVKEKLPGPKPVGTTYVADAADPRKPAILYRLPAVP